MELKSMVEFGKIEALEQANVAISKFKEIGESSLLAIAAVVARVDSLKLYESGGFKSAVEYVSQVFNYKKTQAYDLLNVGRRFVDSETGELLAEFKGFTFSALSEMSRIKNDDDVVALIESGEITPNDSMREVRDVVVNSKGKRVNEKSGRPEKVEEKSNSYHVYRKETNVFEDLGIIKDIASLTVDVVVSTSVVSDVDMKIFYETPSAVGVYICTEVQENGDR